MPCPFIGPIMFCAGSNFLSQPKNLTAFSASSIPFVPAQKPILLNANHLFVWHKMFVTTTICKKKFGLAQKIWTSTKHFGICKRTRHEMTSTFWQFLWSVRSWLYSIVFINPLQPGKNFTPAGLKVHRHNLWNAVKDAVAPARILFLEWMGKPGYNDVVLTWHQKENAMYRVVSCVEILAQEVWRFWLTWFVH